MSAKTSLGFMRPTVKEEITPRGDGNLYALDHILNLLFVKEEITPRGDGNATRGIIKTDLFHVKEEITPRGDENHLKMMCFNTAQMLRKR